jgi:hypothetical protein
MQQTSGSTLKEIVAMRFGLGTVFEATSLHPLDPMAIRKTMAQRKLNILDTPNV